VELTSWGLTKDVEMMPCFVNSPNKTLMGSNSVITLKKKIITVIYKITIIALGKFHKNGS